jgi:Fic/DOC family
MPGKRGRPSRQAVFQALDQARADLYRAGGLPEPIVVGDIWSDIWKEETHHSTAIEGNSLAQRQVDVVLEEGRVTGRKELREYLEVQAYGDAAKWVYGHGRWGHYDRPETLISERDIREIHELVVGTVWAHFPPDPLLPGEGPGAYRKSALEDLRPGLSPAPSSDIPPQMRDWVLDANWEPEGCHLVEHLAELHAHFERIHPFRDGNGRVGRLVLNLLLVRHQYPPLVIYKSQRPRYLYALKKADLGEPGLLAELLARAVKHSIERFLIPAMAGPLALVPLAALADDDLSRVALLSAAQRGRLRAYNARNGWYSTRQWVDEYKASRHQGKRRAA